MRLTTLPDLRRIRAAWLCLALALGLAQPANAELWGYVDAAGVAHLAAKRLDDRFAPVIGPQAGTQRVPGKTDAGQHLLTWLEIAPEVKAVQPWLRESAVRHGVDAELLKAIIVVESGYKRGAMSPRGAVGLMQILPATASRYASPADVARLAEPRINIDTGARMLADLLRRFPAIDTALAAWNAGEGAVRKAGGQMPDIDETRAHVQLVLELYWALLLQARPAQANLLKLHPSPP